MERPFTFINSGWAEIPFHVSLAREMAKLELPVHAVAMGSRYAGAYRRSGAFASVTDMAEWMRDHWEVPGSLADRAQALEDRYGDPGLWQYLASDRRLCRKDYEFNLRAACSQVAFWEQHLPAANPRLLVGEISHFHNYIGWAVARKFDIPYAHIIPARVPGHTAIGNGPYEHRDIVRANYERFRAEGAPADLLEKARRHIESFRSQEKRAAHLAPVRQWYQDPVDIGTVSAFLETARAWLGSEGRFNYTLLPPAAKLKNWTMQKLRRAAMTAMRPFDSLEGRTEPFVLFGLHLQPESSTLVRGRFFQNMLAVIQNVALSLPARYRLYVKEHDVMFGQRPLHFFRALREMPNVVIVSPYESGPALVRRAAAVATVTGTLGWDAALLGKPVFAFGDSFFATYRGVDHVTDMTRLPAIMTERLKNFRPDPAELETFVAAVFASIVPASIDDMWGFRGPENDNNAAILARALVDRADHPPRPL